MDKTIEWTVEIFNPKNIQNGSIFSKQMKRYFPINNILLVYFFLLIWPLHDFSFPSFSITLNNCNISEVGAYFSVIWRALQVNQLFFYKHLNLNKNVLLYVMVWLIFEFKTITNPTFNSILIGSQYWLFSWKVFTIA